MMLEAFAQIPKPVLGRWQSACWKGAGAAFEQRSDVLETCNLDFRDQSWVARAWLRKVLTLLSPLQPLNADLAAVEGPDGTAVAIAWLGEVLIALSRSVTAYYVVRSLPQQPPPPPAALPASSSRRDPFQCRVYERQHLRTS